MDSSNIEIILIVIQLDNGSAHQLLASPEDKALAIEFLGGLRGGIKLDKELKPIVLEHK